MRYLIVAFMFAFCEGYGSEVSCVDGSLRRIDQTPCNEQDICLEPGIREFQKFRTPPENRFAEYEHIREAMGTSELWSGRMRWVHDILSQAASFLRQEIPIEGILLETEMVRCQYKIDSCRFLREVQQWTPKLQTSSAFCYRNYGKDHGYLIFEILRQRQKGRMTAKFCRISASAQPILKTVQKMHRPHPDFPFLSEPR